MVAGEVNSFTKQNCFSSKVVQGQTGPSGESFPKDVDLRKIFFSIAMVATQQARKKILLEQ
jgi:hypothetical protein